MPALDLEALSSYLDSFFFKATDKSAHGSMQNKLCSKKH